MKAELTRNYDIWEISGAVRGAKGTKRFEVWKYQLHIKFKQDSLKVENIKIISD